MDTQCDTNHWNCSDPAPVYLYESATGRRSHRLQEPVRHSGLRRAFATAYWAVTTDILSVQSGLK